MNNKIIIINGPNLNLLGEREQSQYGSATLDDIKENCSKKGQEIGLDIEFAQSNVEGELVNIIQDARKKFDGRWPENIFRDCLGPARGCLVWMGFAPPGNYAGSQGTAAPPET